MASLPAGRYMFRGDEGYEAARRVTVWNQRVPDRYPDVIVQAVDADDVVAAVRYAKANNKRVSIKSGGHSWAANHLRDGAVLLDVSRLEQTAVNADEKTAVVGPGKGGSVLAGELDELGLFFPAGHCKGVCIGGYLLQGGYGWNSRVYGPACESVIGLDVVTADGEKLYVDAENHPDLYWAARGSGPGFFAVVTAFHLKLYPKSPILASSFYAYPIEYADEIYTWAREITADVDRRVEVQIVASKTVPNAGIDRPAIVLASPVFADTEEEARAAFRILDRCPIVDKALIAMPYVPMGLPDWYTAVMSNYLKDHRYTADNMWTSASAEDLLPGIHRIIDTMPPHPSHFLWLVWGPSPARQDMAYSLEDEAYLALYSGWMDAADDDNYADWPRSNMAAMAPLASGIQLADENLGARPAKFVTDDNMAKLDRIRAEYDPDGRFYPWMGRL
ncbi:MAG TPA: FAD-binding oxidoreductase [Mycobacterium sp.]|nr:FAD-binding oxidoreductase [Mycobacterium sp.]